MFTISKSILGKKIFDKRVKSLVTLILASQFLLFGFHLANAESKKYVSVSEGRAHSCALTSVGTIECWGYDGDNRLGLFSQKDYISSPKEKIGISNVINFATGGNTCAITKDNDLFCWGFGDLGKNGNGQTQTITKPEQISKGVKFKQVANGYVHNCAVTIDGEVYCWGKGSLGRIGNGETTDQLVPVKLTKLQYVSSVAVGENQSCAIVSGGKVFCWGYAGVGSMGNGQPTAAVQDVPILVSGIENVTKIVSSGWGVCALNKLGKVLCWGAVGTIDSNGQLQLKSQNLTPVEVEGLPKILDISANREHNCAIGVDSHVYCWGFGKESQLGVGNLEYSKTPVKVQNIDDAVSLSSSGTNAYHTCVVTKVGSIKCWGENYYRQLGQPGNAPKATPVLVGGVPPEPNSDQVNKQISGSEISKSENTIYCIKGSSFKVVKGLNAKCPSGYIEGMPKAPSPKFYLSLNKGCYAGVYPAKMSFSLVTNKTKNYFPVDCSLPHHFEVFAADKISSKNSSFTVGEVNNFCLQKFKNTSLLPASKKIDFLSQGHFAASPGLESKQFPGVVICYVFSQGINISDFKVINEKLVK